MVEEEKRGENVLSRANRLTGGGSFEEIKKQGKVFRSESFGLVFRHRKDNLPSKFGFIVSNRISKKATQRNKIKRAMRDSVRSSLSEIKEGLDIVFLAKQRLLGKDSDKISLDVKEALIKAGLTK